eukprot:TRINITY_DN4420_c0_g1_i1.p1 TRINITY_DN4420_c0_g1~~TRINITY_DN4420_c0_g1_i1.p1  ORF type:complete len:433 (-),score=75.63 TRINITY_DN4420_c0_g1_i1:96-1394(-)
MTISAIFILDSKGKIILSRDYRGDVSATQCLPRFVQRVFESEDTNNLTPIFEIDGVNYIYVKYNNVYLLAVSIRNTDASMVLLFLYKLVEVLKEYFGEVEEESIRDNFVITYELLDEMIDFGYPQVSEPRLLKEYITQQGHQLLKSQVKVPKAITGAVSWRPEGLVYKKNEVFLDVIEKVNLLVSASGTLLRSEILGKLNVKAFLTGMPELRLGLNDRVNFTGRERGDPNDPDNQQKKPIELEDVKFHQCVRLQRIESEKAISFVPPDGEFELMSYRLSTQIKPLIWIHAVVESHKHSRMEYLVKARAQFKSRSFANNVEIIVPVPPDADTPAFQASVGTVKYVPEKDAVIWSIKQMQGGKEFIMRAHFGLPSIEAEDSVQKPPIEVKFEIPYFTVSGIQVRYLRIVEKSGYQALPWVRYITQNGEYQMRMT